MSKADKILKRGLQKGQPKLTLYEQLYKEDWTRFFIPNMNAGRASFDENGKFTDKHLLSKETPWLFNKALSISPRLIMNKCTEYHDYFADEMEFVHSRCQECWKVVVNLQTVEQLFTMRDLQQGHFKDVACKCGIELRPYVLKLYSAYFYTNSVEEGRKQWKEVQEVVHKQISPKIKVTLKRGCTEFENKFGPSDQWKVVPEQLRYEEKFKDVFITDYGPAIEFPDYLISYVKRKWLHWASDHYDVTVWKWIGEGVWLPKDEFAYQLKPYLFPHGQAVT